MKLLWLICITVYTCIVVVRSESEADVMKKVSAGADAGNAIVTALSSNDLSQTLATVATKMAPFLGAFGPILSLVTLFMPKGESAELKLMKQKFAEMDAKFDRVFSGLEELKNIIKKQSVLISYSHNEKVINALTMKLELLLTADNSTMQGRLNDFTKLYSDSYKSAAYDLWRGMVENYFVININIPKSLIANFKYDRKKVDHSMLGIMHLILKGVIVELANRKITDTDAMYKSDTKLWTDRMNQLIQRIVDEDRKCMLGYFNQSNEDVKILAAQYQGASHDSFADAVYNFLKGKYYWREWFVVVYDPIHSSDNHIIKTCDGHSNFRLHGFNVVTSSLVRSVSSVELDVIHKLFGKLKLYTTPWTGVEKRPARDIYESLPAGVQKGCTVRSVGVILTSAKPVYRAPKDLLETFQRSFYTLSAFG